MNEYEPSLVEKLAAYFTTDLAGLPSDLQIVVNEYFHVSWDGLSASQRASEALRITLSAEKYTDLTEEYVFFIDDLERFLKQKESEPSVSEGGKYMARLILDFINDSNYKEVISAFDNHPKGNKGHENKARTTLLVIIAALAKKANLEISTTTKTAKIIEGLTQMMGCDVGPTTIVNTLKAIPDAIERRAK